jgi:hypothetical protein
MRVVYHRTETVAEFLTKVINASGKTQTEICYEIGYTKPNIITMFKQGKTKVPLDKIGPLARSLGVDGRDFFRMVLGEYMPETLRAIEPYMTIKGMTSQETFLLETYRAACGDKEQVYVLFNPKWLKQNLIKA